MLTSLPDHHTIATVVKNVVLSLWNVSINFSEINVRRNTY